MMSEAQTEQPLSINQLAAVTGLSVSTLRRRVKEGVLTAVQLGGRGKKLLFASSAVHQFCQAGADEGEETDRPGSGSAMSADKPSVAAGSPEDAGAPDHSPTRPINGRIPQWMQNPLLHKTKSQSISTEK